MNDKKMAIISILLIVSITISVLFANNSFNFENTLTGKAINQIETENLVEDETPEEKFEIPDYLELKSFSENCEAICPLGYDLINSTCNEINYTCEGSVICGLYENGTIVNMDNGHCAKLKVVAGVYPR